MESRPEVAGKGVGAAPETLPVHAGPGRERAHRTLNAPLYPSPVWKAATDVEREIRRGLDAVSAPRAGGRRVAPGRQDLPEALT